MSGSKNSHIATWVERHTRYAMLAKVANKDTQTVISALIKQAKKLPNELYKSLTWDRGKELTDMDDYAGDQHRRLLLRSASPGSAGRTRTPMACYNSTFRRELTYRCTRKPISTKWRVSSTSGHRDLEFETPAEKFNACVASTG